MSTLYPWNAETFGVIFGIIGTIVAFTSISLRGQDARDRLYYDAIRANVSFAPPRWLFAPVWTVLVVLFMLNAIFFFISPVSWTPPNDSYTLAAAVLFVVWLLTYAVWTAVFFGARLTFLAVLDSVFLLAATIVLLVLELSAGETRWWVTWLFLMPTILWVSFATMLTIAVLVKTIPIARSLQIPQKKVYTVKS